MTLSNAAIAECFAPETGVVFHTLMTIDHPSWGTPVRLVDNGEDVVSNGNTFIAMPFKLALPTIEGDSAPEVTVEIDNVHRDILATLRQDVTAASVTLEIVLSNDLDTVEISVSDLKLRVTEYDVLLVTGTLMFDFPLNTGFIGERYTPYTAPGVFIVR